MYDENVEKCVEGIQDFMKAFDIPEDDIGMVISPRYDEEKDSMRLDYFVRTYQNDFKPVIDASVYTDVSALEINNRVYREWIETLEEEFEEAEIMAMDPEDLEIGPKSPHRSNRKT